MLRLLRKSCFSLLTIALLLTSADVLAEVRLPAILSDHMVLQRDMPLPVWGWADPGEEVVVVIAGQSHKTVADAAGKWRVMLNPLQVGASPEGDQPLTMTVSGSNQIVVSDLLVGEVWLCSGQSNMGWTVGNSWNADLEIPKANHPGIRLISITTPGTQETIETCDAKWNVCSPETVGEFSGVGYFFGLELYERLGVPVGLIDNAWGGSACEAWIPLDRMEGDPMYAALLERWKKTAQEFDAVAVRAKYNEDLKVWEAKVAAGEKGLTRPQFRNPLIGQHRPANLYHGRLGPVKPFGICGVIWYQGETNAGRSYQYREMFPLMIRTWRDVWGQGDFPFYWVQLADYLNEVEEPQESGWAELREAQTLTLDREPNTGEAVIIDLGEGKDIHPREKMEVARRLARHALANDYGMEIDHTSPRYKSMVVEGNKIVITLQGEGKGIRTFDTNALQGFVIAGEDQQWHNAQATIVGDRSIEVSCAEVLKPVAVRYAWANNPVCNLITWSGLPVTPFRTDDWPGATIDAR